MKKSLTILIVAVLLIIGHVSVSQAVVPANLAGTSWILQGKATVASRYTGAMSTQGGGIAEFDLSGHFYIEDEAGYGLEGAYSVDAKGNVDIDIASETIEDFILDNLGNYAGYVDTIEVTSVTTKAKATESNGLGKLSISMRFVVIVTVEGTSVKISYKMASKGVRAMAEDVSEGSMWRVDFESQVRASGFKEGDDGQWMIILGPSSAYGLAYNEFKIYYAEGDQLEDVVLEGQYYQQKTKVTFMPYNYSLEQCVDDVAQGIIDDHPELFDVYTDVLNGNMTATIKKGVMKLNGTISFVAEVDTEEDGWVATKGTLKVKAEGEEYTPVVISE